jgi:hypothetical protein
MSYKLRHGIHNKELCLELHSQRKYNDWVLTTAFYSAIHYFDHKIFPLSADSKKFESLDSCLKHFRAYGRHDCRKKIISRFLPKLLNNYNYLDKNCRNARYIDYQVNDTKAALAIIKLEEIIKECAE